MANLEAAVTELAKLPQPCPLITATRTIPLPTLADLQRSNQLCVLTPRRQPQPPITSVTSSTHVALTSHYATSTQQPLNAQFAWFGDARNAIDVSKDLRRKLLQLYGEFVDDEGKRVDYAAMRTSDAFVNYTIAAAELQRVDVSPLSPQERLAFFINIYNSLIIHAKAVGVQGKNVLSRRLSFFDTAAYAVGGVDLTANDIEHGILRANAPAPGLLGVFRRQWWGGGRADSLSLPTLDPRIHFALNCGANSCPAIRVYDGGNIDAALEAAARGFVRQEVQLVEGGTAIELSKIFEWYGHDFASDSRALVQRIADWAEDDVRAALLRVLEDGGGPPRLVFREYDWGDNDEQ